MPISETDIARIREAATAKFGGVTKFMVSLGLPKSAFNPFAAGDVSLARESMITQAIERDLGIQIQQAPAKAPAGPVFDCLAKLQRRGFITAEELEAGKRLRAAAAGWHHPGLNPAQPVLNSWSPALRAMWAALRSADAAVPGGQRPAPPTPSAATWSAAVLNLAVGVDDMATLELAALRQGLQALIPVARDAWAMAAAVGKPRTNYKMTALRRAAPDLADQVERGEISLARATDLARASGALAVRAYERKAQATFPPKSQCGKDQFRFLELNAPGLASAVARGEIALTRAYDQARAAREALKLQGAASPETPNQQVAA